MEFKFSDLVNVPLLQDMAEKLYLAAGIPIGIIDVDGNIQVQSGWQRICTDFHRANSESCMNCKLSDRYIFDHIAENNFVEYKCKNNMWDIAMSIIIDETYVATLFVGQFFYSDEIIDYDLFYEQAERFGFDTKEYMDALEKVPVFSKDRVYNMLNYYQNYIKVLAESGMKTLQKQSYISKIQQYADIVAEMKTGLLVFNFQKNGNKSKLTLQSANPAAAQMFHFEVDNMIGKSIYEILPNIETFNIIEHLINTASKKQQSYSSEICCSDDDINKSWYSFNAFSIPDKCLGLMIEDITDRKMAEGEIVYLSYHDQLTGLYNRRYFEEELRRYDVERNYPLAIIMADVNGLKFTNDTFGHQLGDLLLIAIADSLRQCTRKDEIIARLGGDEFVMLLPHTDLEKAEVVINRILDYISDKTVGVVNLSAAFGAATKEDATEDIQLTMKRAEDRMYQMKVSAHPSIKSDMIATIMSYLYNKCKRLKIHSDRIACICIRFGQALGMSEQHIKELKTTALLHDIGKIGIDEKILNKKAVLSNEEFDEIKRHPEIGARILRASTDMAAISDYVLYHHERWDGNGYPMGLCKEEIPLQSRIIAIVDTFDSLMYDKSYCKKMSETEAIKEIEKSAGSLFDPSLVEIFLDKVVVSRNNLEEKT